MSSTDIFTIHTDGASRGNPGPSAYAYVIQSPSGASIEHKDRLDDTTNNVAEYTALIKALEHAQQLGARRLLIHSDSELMIKQLEGSYAVRNEGLRPLYEDARDLLREFAEAKLRHVRREHNKRADELCNEALDGDSAKPATAKAPRKTKKSAPPKADVRAAAVDCLRSVANVWALGNPTEPSPEQVWEQLWTILEEGGVLK